MFFDQQTLTTWLQTNSFIQLSAGQYGGTFVDWSINYLCDISRHTVVEINGFNEVAIPTNPVIGTGSAHQHIKNFSGNPGEICWQWHFLHNHLPDSLHTFYMSMPTPWSNNFIKNSHEIIQFNEFMDSYICFVTELFLKNSDIPHILVYPDFDTASWMWLRRCRTISSITKFDDFNKENKLAPFNVDLTLPKEEVRENLALLSVPYYLVAQQISQNQLKLKDSLPNCYAVSVSEIFGDLESVLRKIQANSPSLRFSETKWDSWRNIYAQWKDKNIAELNWYKDIGNTIEKILNQTPCPTHELSELQELAIEIELLLKGYSIKNFKLKSFPDDLSLLELEPSIHQEHVNKLINAAQSKIKY